VTEVFIHALENRAKALNIFDVRPFLRSSYLRNFGLEVDESKGVIRKYYLKDRINR
jgi:hypothetical protein